MFIELIGISVDEFLNKFESKVFVGDVVYDYEVDPGLEKDI